MKFERMIKSLTIGSMIVFFFYAIYHYWFWLLNPNTNEYREGVVLLIGDLFQRGVNPYTDAAPGNSCFLYGFLGSWLVAVCQGLMGVGSRFLENRLLSIICTVGCAAVVEQEVRFWTRGKFPRYLAFLIMLNAGWILGEVDSRSDQLAMLLYVVSMRCISRHQTVFRIVVSAVLVVMSFYCKQYAVLVGAPVFVFLLFRRPMSALVYAIMVSVFLVASMLVVNMYFPYYFTMSILSHMILGYNVVHAIVQTAIFSWFYWPFLLAITIVGWLMIQKLRSRGASSLKDEVKNFPLLYILAVAFGICFLIFKLAGNPGSVLWYYNLILMPSLVIAGTYAMMRLPSAWFLRILLPGIILFSLWHLGPSRQGFRLGAFAFTPTLDIEEQKAWSSVKSDIAQCQSNRILLEAPFFVDIALARGIVTFETGVSFPEWVQPSCELDRFAKLRAWFFPNSEAALRHSNAYYESIRRDVENGSFDMLVVEPSKSVDIPNCYEKKSEYSLRMGEQVREVCVYVKKSKPPLTKLYGDE